VLLGTLGGQNWKSQTIINCVCTQLYVCKHIRDLYVPFYATYFGVARLILMCFLIRHCWLYASETFGSNGLVVSAFVNTMQVKRALFTVEWGSEERKSERQQQHTQRKCGKVRQQHQQKTQKNTKSQEENSSHQSCQKPRHLPSSKRWRQISGARCIWGTLKTTTCAAVSSSLKRLTRFSDQIKGTKLPMITTLLWRNGGLS